jgi:diguanylate cyclase (GGDEF)-like protein
MVALNILVICAAAAIVPNDVRAISNLMLLPIAAIYVATWFSRRQMWAYLALMTSASLVVVVVHGIGASFDLLAMWTVLTVSSIGIAAFINILVSHLSEQATIDPLTGLQNRAGLAGVADEYSRRGGGGQPRTVVVIDLDGFKVVNDQFGHEAGDEVLRQVAAAMRLHLRPYDVISRVGGDEFVLLLMRTAADQSELVVERLIQALPIPASFGIADWPEGTRVDEAIARSDVRMYESKARRKIEPGQEPVGSS